MMYTNYRFGPMGAKLYTTKPSIFYFYVPEIKKIKSKEQLNFNILSSLSTEVPILVDLHSYVENYNTIKKPYFPLPLKDTLAVKEFCRTKHFIDNLDNYNYRIYKTKKETNHFIGGKSVLFDGDYNLLFLITAKAVQIPREYLYNLHSQVESFFQMDFKGNHPHSKDYFIFRDSTINVSNLLIDGASNSQIYNSILMHLLKQATLKGWKFVIDKNLHKKWIVTPTAPKLKDIKTSLNTYIGEELKGIIDNIVTYE